MGNHTTGTNKAIQAIADAGGRLLSDARGPENSKMYWYGMPSGRVLLLQEYPDGNGFEIYSPVSNTNKVDDTINAAINPPNESQLLLWAKLNGGGDSYIQDYGRTCHCPFTTRKGGFTREQMLDENNHATGCNELWKAIQAAMKGSAKPIAVSDVIYLDDGDVSPGSESGADYTGLFAADATGRVVPIHGGSRATIQQIVGKLRDILATYPGFTRTKGGGS